MRNLNHTIDVLAKAYLQGTFLPIEPCCCAIGNIIADSKNLKIVPNPQNTGYMWVDSEDQFTFVRWDFVFCGCIPGDTYGPSNYHLIEGGIKEIKETGYTVQELFSIEVALFSGMIDFIEEDSIDIDLEQLVGRFVTLTEDFNDEKSNEVHFHGLMAVVDKLYEIHGVEDIESKKKAKLKFVKT